MHIMAPMADFSFLLKIVTKSVSRLATATLGSAHSERKMRYQRSDSWSNSSATNIRRFSGMTFRGSKTSLTESNCEGDYASLHRFQGLSLPKLMEAKANPGETDALDEAWLHAIEQVAHRDNRELGEWGISVINDLDDRLAEERTKSGASTPDAEKAARPREEDIYTLPCLSYRETLDNKYKKANAAGGFQGDPLIPRIAANSAAWGRLLKPRVIVGTLKAPRGGMQAENRQTGATHLGDG